MTETEDRVILRSAEPREHYGKIRLWFYWECFCGAKLHYLNQTAMVLGSQGHREKHLATQKSKTGIPILDEEKVKTK